jgi:hypothetical protein
MQLKERLNYLNRTKLRYPSYVPQNKEITLFYIEEINVKNDDTYKDKYKDLPPLGVMRCIMESFLAFNFFEGKRTILIEKIVGANDLFDLVMLTCLRYKIKDYSFSFTNDVIDPNNNIELRNVKIKLLPNGKKIVTFEFNGAKWKIDNLKESNYYSEIWTFSCTTDDEKIKMYRQNFEKNKKICKARALKERGVFPPKEDSMESSLENREKKLEKEGIMDDNLKKALLLLKAKLLSMAKSLAVK